MRGRSGRLPTAHSQQSDAKATAGDAGSGFTTSPSTRATRTVTPVEHMAGACLRLCRGDHRRIDYADHVGLARSNERVGSSLRELLAFGVRLRSPLRLGGSAVSTAHPPSIVEDGGYAGQSNHARLCGNAVGRRRTDGARKRVRALPNDGPGSHGCQRWSEFTGPSPVCAPRFPTPLSARAPP